MEYCRYVWDSDSTCYFEMLGKPLKQICRAIGPSLGASREPLANVTSLFCMY